MHVAQDEPTWSRRFGGVGELGGVWAVAAGGAAGGAFDAGGAVGVGLGAAEAPEAGVAEGAVVEVHGVLGGDDDADAERRWLTPVNGRTPGVIVSVAHLDDDERALVLGVLLEEVLTWVRSLPGSKNLRALIVFDE